VKRGKWQDRLEDFERRGFDKCRVGRGVIHVQCSQCNAMMINGIAVHEATCPNEARARRAAAAEDAAEEWD